MRRLGRLLYVVWFRVATIEKAPTDTKQPTRQTSLCEMAWIVTRAALRGGSCFFGCGAIGKCCPSGQIVDET